MVAVLVAKIVGAMQGCPPGEHGQPCNWYVYAAVGAVVGGISLPILALRRLRRGDAAAAREAARQGATEAAGETQNEG